MPARSDDTGDATRTFGALLREHRWRETATQEVLAERAGLSVRTVRNLESGRTAPRSETVRLLADALQLDAEARTALMAAAWHGSPDPAVGPGSRQLPPDVPDFTGRREVVARLTDLLRDGGAAVAAVVGPPGVGKSALAVHVAHRLRSPFPDGQLYVDLRGGRTPLDPGEALAQLLRALGVPPATVPADPQERAALFRSRLAGQRVLVVLDDAASAGQVRPLLPAGPGCAVLVTSRRRPTGLPGATVLGLEVLPEPDAVELLERVAGRHRVGDDPAAGRRVAILCGRLPLAIRVAGARLAARPQWSLDRLGDLLADSHRRLDELSAGDLAVRASIDLSYQALPDGDRRALRRLAVLDLPVLPGWVVSAALDYPDQDAAEEAADRLVDASLLAFAGVDRDGSAAYEFHDLLRIYGQDAAAAQDGPAERDAVLDRALAVALALADEAAAHGMNQEERRPQSGLRRGVPAERTLEMVSRDPVTWFEGARPALTALIRHAAATGRRVAVWDLATRLLPFFEFGHWFEDWAMVLTEGLAAAEATGPAAMPLLRRQQGEYAMAVGDLAAAERHLREAAALSVRIGDTDGLGWAHYRLGVAAHGHGRVGEAMTEFRAADRAFRAGGVVAPQVRFGLGVALRELGDLAGAEEQFDRALATARAQDDFRLVAHLLRWLAEVHADLDRPAEAERELAECSAMHRAIDDRLGEGYALQLTAELQLRAGRPDARLAADRALAVFDAIGSRQGAALVLRTAARCALAAGDAARARRDAARAAELFGELAMDLGHGRSLAVLAEAAEAVGDHADARVTRERALALLAPLGVPEATELAEALGQPAEVGGPAHRG